MSKPYDATGKELLETGPADWVAFLGRSVDPACVTLIDADLSTVTAAADKVISIAENPQWLMNVEVQASADRDLPRRLLSYAGLLHSKHDCHVASVALLLRPEANHPRMTGRVTIAPPIGPAWDFHYRIMRAWELDPAAVLSAGLGILPLAPISAAQPEELPGIINIMRRRIESEANPSLADKLWTCASVFMGLRYEESFTDRLLEGVFDMNESTTVQKWLRLGRAEGRHEEIRNVLLKLGAKRYGPPNPTISAKMANEQNIEKLEKLVERVYDVTSWDDLFAE